MPVPLDDTLPALFAVVDQAPVGVALLGADGRVVFENARLRALAGEGGVWTGREAGHLDALSGDLRAAVRALVARGRPFEDVEGTLARPGGPRRVLASGVRLDDAGDAAAVLTVLDVTAARDGEAALALHARVQTAEAALHQAALAQPDALALLETAVARLAEALHADGGLAFVGDGEAFVRVAASPPDALPDLADLDAAACAAGRATATNALPGCEAALLLPVRGAAEAVLVLARGTAFTAAETAAAERLAALFSTLWAWTEAEARFRRTVADLDDALFTVAYDADGRRGYAFVSPQAEALTGLDPDALLAGDADWAERVHPDDRAAFDAHDARLRAGEASRVDVRLQVGAQTVWVAERATPGVDAAGRAVAGGLLQDISAQKAAEATLDRARRTAERAAQTRMAFLRLMSHELRTPLGAIRGFAELLGEEVAALPDAPPEIPEFATTIRESAERALRLVSDLLDLSRLETGALPLRAEPVCLHAVAAAAAAGVEGAAVPVRLSGGPARALADPDRAAQVVRQLVANAAQVTTVGEIEVRAEAVGRTARVSVRDTGPGLDDVVLEGLFEPLVQADVRVNRDREGTGLGLAIASRLARAMGGRLEVQSQPGAGSTFTLVLPAA